MRLEEALKLFNNMATEISSSSEIYYITKEDVDVIIKSIYADFDKDISELKHDISILDAELHYERGNIY